ncbi:MAG: protein kinase domain-containing protein [Bradymonadia bacterium]
MATSVTRKDEPSVNDLIDRLLDITPRFEIQGELARGAMGRIMAGWDLHLGRPVAIKLLRRSTPRDLDRIRFLEEAQVTGQLQHPSIMPVYEIGRIQDQVGFVMKRIEGRSLKEIIGSLQRGEPDVEREFGLNRILQIFGRLCLAVAYAHSRGVVHRDLKPSNVMVGDFGEVVLLDWGLCKIISQQTRSSRSTSGRWRTVHGQIIGTPAYMAPEQAMGQIDAVDPRTDVYGLGAILYHLLTLAPPFGGKSNREIIRKVLNGTVPSARKRAPHRDIPPEVERLVMTCLSRDPAERYPNAKAVTDALDHLRNAGALSETRTHPMIMDSVDTRIEECLAKGVAALNRQQSLLEDAALVSDTLLTGQLEVAPDDPPEAKAAVWSAEDRLVQLEAQVAEAYAEAVAALTTVVALDRDHYEARSMLCDLFMARYDRAEASGDGPGLSYYRRLIAEYHDGRHQAFLDDRGSLQVDIHPPEAEVWLTRFEARSRRLTSEDPQPLTGQPLMLRDLPAGRYQIRATAPGHEALITTLIIQSGQSTRLRLRMLPHHMVPDGFVHIPAGTFRYGSARSSIWMPSEQALPDFLIGHRPVTVAEYGHFVQDVASRNPQEALARVPRTHDGTAPAWQISQRGEVLIPGVNGTPGPWQAESPVVSISAHDAAAYCQWLGERLGARLRLPTEEEWEKACRGADGRHYPWGFHWEATYTVCPETWSGPLPPAVGHAPADLSPYGVQDLAGCVREWTATLEPGPRTQVAIRGGSFLTGGQGSRPAWARDVSPANRTAPDLGFRLARDITF